MNSFRPLGTVVGRSFVGSKGSRVVSVLLIRQMAQKTILKICADLGEDMLKLIKVSTFKNNTLTLVCPSLIASELQMRSEGLKEGINETVGREVVVRLRFKVG